MGTDKILPELLCLNCGHEGNDYKIEAQGAHTKCSCGNCGAYIKFLSKEDKYGTKEQQAAIWEKTKGRCGYCGTLLNPFTKNGYTYDHIEAQNAGGGHQEANLMACCKSCNSQKGKKPLGEYRRYMAGLRGKPTHVFYFEVQEYSSLGDILSSLYLSKP